MISERLDGARMTLGWERYIESVDKGSEVWVYFHGPHKFENGVYIKGVVDAVDISGRTVHLKPQEYSEDKPLTDAETTRRVAVAVGVRFRQVFLLPEELEAPACLLATTAQSCAARQCGSCATWKKLPRVKCKLLGHPERLERTISGFVPACWVIPRRSFILSAGTVRRAIRQTSELFSRFKTGEEELAYPLALGIYRSLEEAQLSSFDAIVPIPLSPDKAKAGEIHRTKLLAKELSRLMGVPVREVLGLSRPISKRRLGLGARQFENRYREALQVDLSAATLQNVLLVDDVCTKGSTLSCAAEKLKELNPDCEIVAATAGQMVVRAAVSDEQPLLETA